MSRADGRFLSVAVCFSDLEGAGIDDRAKMYCRRETKIPISPSNNLSKPTTWTTPGIEPQHYRERNGETANSLSNVNTAAAWASSMIFLNDSGPSNPLGF